MHGLVLGKFMPPHNGHLYLVDFARHYAEELTLVVGSLQAEPIPGELRFAWMRELFPQVEVVHLTDENPQHPSQHPDFWKIWRNSLTRVVPRKIDLVFASEDYGGPLAEVLGARFIPLSRKLLTVSGTAIRSDPLAHWAYLPPPVRAYYARRISIFGPESTGKSTLAEKLARHFQTIWVPEFARDWLERKQGEVSREDMPIIARGQRASEEALARQANRLLFCDTDPSATQLWSQELFGDCPAELLAQVGSYHLTLLCAPDVPWVDDVVRYRPDGGQPFWQKCYDLLAREGRQVMHLHGDWEQRWQQALTALRAEPRDASCHPHRA